MWKGRVAENDNEAITIPNPMTFTGAVVFAGGSAIGSIATPLAVASTGTTELASVHAYLNTVSGILRSVLGHAELRASQSGTVNLYGVRGYAKIGVGGTFNDGSAYAAGVQGCFEVAGTMIGGRAACVLAQLQASAGTLTSGEVFGVWIDNQMTSLGGLTAHMLGMENTVDGVTMAEFIYCYGRATYFATFGGTQTFLKTSGANPTTAAGQIAINTPAGVRYIPLFSTTA